MKIRKTGPLLLVLAAGGASAPALADCCSSFWSCAATVVTEGVSCEVQTIIDTIHALYTEVLNFGNDLTGETSSKEQGARQYVTDTINNMQSQSQQSAADLAAALSQVLAGGAEIDGLVARGARRSAEFSWDACARGLADLYEDARAWRTSGPGRGHQPGHPAHRDVT